MADTKTIELIRDTLTELLDYLQVAYNKIEVAEEEGGIVRANIDTERAPFLIGTYGERVNALQQILKNLLWKKDQGKDVFVIVDVDNYKKAREERMISLAKQKAEAAKETGIVQTMPIMEPYLRRLVHLMFTQEEYAGFKTESVGESGARRLQISCVE